MSVYTPLTLKLGRLLRAGLFLGAFFILGIASVSAAAPAGTLTGSTTSLTVGSTAAMSTITVTDAGGEITAANNILIRIPSGVNATWDTTDTTTNAYGGSASAKASTTVTYPNSKTLSIDVTSDFTAGQTLIISGLSYVPTAANTGAALTWAVDGTTFGTGNSNTNITITAADAAASVALGANSVVGVAGNTVLTITIPVAMANTDTILFTMPSNLDVSGATFASETFAGAGTISTCSPASQVITCTANGAITAGTGTITMTGIVSIYVDSSQTITSISVRDADATSGANANTATDSSGTVTDTTVGTLSSTNVQPTSLVEGESTTNTISFTTTVAMANGAKLVIVYPSGFNVAALNGTTASSLSGLDGTWTASVSSQTVTLTQSGGGTTSAGAKSLMLSGIVNPGVTGSGGTYSLTTKIGAGNNIQTDAAVTADTITGGRREVASILGDITGVTLTDDENGGVKITWSEPDDDTTGVQILKGTSPDTEVDGTPLVTIAAGYEEYVDENVEAGQTVFYQLRTTDGISTGDLSEVVTFTVGSGATTTSTDTDTTSTSDDSSSDDSTSDDSSSDDSTSDDSSSDDSSSSVTFTDVLPSWAETAIGTLSASGVIEGNPDGTFAPANNLNRAEAATMLWRVLMMGNPEEATEMPFTDIALGEWYTNFIAGLKGLSLVSGNPDGTYQPAESINRAEFLKLAMNVYMYMHASTELSDESMTTAYADLDASAWYAQTVSNATAWGFVEGSSCDEGTCFNAGSEINRAEAAQILYNMFGDMLANEGESWTVTLDEQDGSGEMGTALITQENGDLVVELTMTGESDGASQPAHIHSGTCGSGGAAVYTLENIVDGMSTTTLDVDWATLVSQEPLYINVHASEEDLDTIMACGEL